MQPAQRVRTHRRHIRQLTQPTNLRPEVVGRRHPVAFVKQQRPRWRRLDQLEQERSQHLGHLQSAPRILGLPRGHPQHPAFIIDIARHPSRHLALPQSQVQHQQRAQGRRVPGLRQLQRLGFKAPRFIDAQLRLADPLATDRSHRRKRIGPAHVVFDRKLVQPPRQPEPPVMCGARQRLAGARIGSRHQIAIQLLGPILVDARQRGVLRQPLQLRPRPGHALRLDAARLGQVFAELPHRFPDGVDLLGSDVIAQSRFGHVRFLEGAEADAAGLAVFRDLKAELVVGVPVGAPDVERAGSHPFIVPRYASR